MTQSTFVFGGASWAQLSSTAFTHSQRGSNTIVVLFCSTPFRPYPSQAGPTLQVQIPRDRHSNREHHKYHRTRTRRPLRPLRHHYRLHRYDLPTRDPTQSHPCHTRFSYPPLLPLAVRRRLRHHRPWQLARLTQRAAVGDNPCGSRRGLTGSLSPLSLYELLFILMLVSRVQIEKEVKALGG